AVLYKSDIDSEPTVKWIMDETGAPMEMLHLPSQLHNSTSAKLSPGAAFSLDTNVYLYYSITEDARSVATGLGLMNCTVPDLVFENAFEENYKVLNVPAASVFDPNDSVRACYH